MPGRRRVLRAGPVAVVAGAVVAGDQLSKAWAWRHVERVTVDTGGGVLDAFTGGVANAVLSEPFVGAAVNVVIAAVLWWTGWRVSSRPRSWPVTAAATVALAAGASNLLDRLGVHRLTAPGSTRGVVNWISVGGGQTSPMNAADLLLLAAGVAFGAIALARFVRRHPMPGRRQRVLTAAAVVVTGVSLAGAVHAGDGSRGRPEGRASAPAPPTVPTTVDTDPPGVDRGAPVVAASIPVSDALEGVVTRGEQVTVTWTSEAVTVTGRSVLGWRTDGVSTRYLHAVVIGPTRVELYLPPVDPGSPSALCRWRAVPPAPDDTAAVAPAVWECDPGQAALTLTTRPVPFP